MRVFLSLFGVLVLLCVSSNPADAGPFRNRSRPAAAVSYSQASSVTSSCANGVCTTTVATSTVVTVATSGAALDEVNAKRAARGLRPFVHDPLLTAAAERCAAFRATQRMFGHTSNDFAFLLGASASAAGCAAYPASYGFMACCVYDGYTYAGAATVVGPDGRSYHHIFVR